MTWLTPLTGLFLALAVIPPLILLYFLKLRRRPQPIPCTILWKRSVEDLQANAPFQRLRRNLLLFLQLLALTALILSVMQPQVEAGERAGGKIVFLVDNSASMAATDVPGGQTRLDVARELLRERIEALYGGGLFSTDPGEAMIIAFSDRAEVKARFTNSRRQLLAAVDRIQQTHGETRIEEALQLARAYTTNVVDEMGEARPVGEPAHLELFSDGQIADLADQVLRGESMTYHAIGTENPDNVAIASIAVERPFDRPAAVEVFASLLNFNETEVLCDVQLSVDDTARGIREIRVPPARPDERTGELLPGRNNVVFAPFDQPRGAIIEVAVLREDDLAVDNVARVAVPPPKRLTVALVAPGSYVIRSVLEGMNLQQLDVLTADQYDEIAAAGEDGRLDVYDVIVFDNHVPETLPPGRYLSFGDTPPVEGLNEFGRGESQLILATRDEHPVMRYVNLNDLFIARYALIQPGEEVRVLAEGSRAPAVFLIETGGLHMLHVPFDPLDSNWPFLRSFVTFMVNAVDYLGHVGERLTTQGFRPGEAITARLPAGAHDVRLQIPGGRTVEPAVSEAGHVSWGPIELAGVYRLSWNEPGRGSPESRDFAVNMLSETEGDLRVVDELALGQERVAGRRAGESGFTALWPWLLGICLMLLMIEWWVYHRKARI